MSENEAARKAEEAHQNGEAIREVAEGAMTGGVKGAAVAGGKALLKNKKARRLGRRAVAVVTALAAVGTSMMWRSKARTRPASRARLRLPA